VVSNEDRIEADKMIHEDSRQRFYMSALNEIGAQDSYTQHTSSGFSVGIGGNTVVVCETVVVVTGMLVPVGTDTVLVIVTVFVHSGAEGGCLPSP
jgi:hypothetical protein